MATRPVFANTPIVSVAVLSAANTNRDGSGTIVTVLDPPAGGCKLNRIIIKAEDDPADSVVILWIQIASVWIMLKEVDLENPADATNTVTAFEYEVNFADRDINLADANLIGATLTAAPTAGDVNVIAFAGGF